MSKYLVAYISKTNTTKEIAEKIVEKFQANSLDCEAKSIHDVDSLDHYEGVVLASPINGMRTLPDFKAFIARIATQKEKVMGLFIVSIIYHHGRKGFRKIIHKDLDRLVEILEPQHVAVFGGRSENPMTGLPRVLFGLPKGLPSDLRDWTEIDSWIEKMISGLKVA